MEKTIFASPLETQLQRLNQTSGMVRMLVLVTQAFAKQFALEKQQKKYAGLFPMWSTMPCGFW